MNERPALPSLLDRAPSLPGLALDDLDADERNQATGAGVPMGEFTAERFARSSPERYALVARALQEGFSLDTCARVFKIHERTAAAVREREARSLSAEAYRGVQARHARGLVLAATDTLAERLRRDPDSISARDLVAVVRELHNVERALEGAPSTIAGVIRADGATAALADLLQQAAAAGAASNRFGGGKNPPREGSDPSPAVVVEAVALPAGAKESHITGGASDCNFNASPASDTGDDTRPGSAGVVSAAGASDQESAATGAGGVPREQGGPFRVDRSAPENFASSNQSSVSPSASASLPPGRGCPDVAVLVRGGGGSFQEDRQ